MDRICNLCTKNGVQPISFVACSDDEEISYLKTFLQINSKQPLEKTKRIMKLVCYKCSYGHMTWC